MQQPRDKEQRSFASPLGSEDVEIRRCGLRDCFVGVVMEVNKKARDATGTFLSFFLTGLWRWQL